MCEFAVQHGGPEHSNAQHGGPEHGNAQHTDPEHGHAKVSYLACAIATWTCNCCFGML